MTAAYRAGSLSQAYQSSAGAITVNKAVGQASGDFVLILIDIDRSVANTITWPTGFTQLFNLSNAAPDGQILAAAYKFDAGSEPSTYTITPSDAYSTQASVTAWTGVDTSSPFTLGAASFSTAYNNPPINMALTGLTALANDALLLLGMIDRVAGTDTWGVNTVAGFTLLTSYVNAWNNQYIQYELGASAGATGTLTVVTTGGSNNGAGWGGYQLALHSAAGTGPSATAESAALTDTGNASVVRTANGADSVATADTSNRSVITSAVNSDSVATTDTPNATKRLTGATTEAATLAETSDRSIISTAARADSVVIADSQTNNVVSINSVAEALAITDTQVVSLIANTITLESLTLADSSNGFFTGISADQTESVATSDTTSTSGKLNSAVAESLATSSSTGNSAILNVTRADFFSIIDSPSNYAIFNAARVEQVSILDQQSVQGTSYSVSINENIATTDSQTVSAIIGALVYEQLNVADLINNSIIYYVVIEEVTTLLDSSTASGGTHFNVSVVESTDLADFWQGSTPTRIYGIVCLSDHALYYVTLNHCKAEYYVTISDSEASVALDVNPPTCEDNHNE